MKKTICTLSLACLLVSPAFGYSTCETRVDSHQNATTPQRVAYCLTEEDVRLATAQNPELVYYGVTDKTPQAAQTQKPSKNKNPYFDEDKIEVTQGYVGTQQFPEFKNDILSEQERLAQRQALLVAEQAAAQKADYHVTGEKPAKVQPVVAAQTIETKAGLAKRKTKPAREMKRIEPVVEETVPQEAPLPEPAQQAEEVPSSAELGVTPQPDVADLQSPYDMPYTDETNIPYGAN